MKKITLIALCLPAFMNAQPAKYILNGKLTKQSGPAKVYLNKVVNEALVVDSAVVQNGEFRFEGTVEGPIRAMLILDTKGGGIDFMQLPPDADTRIFFLEEGTTKVVINERVSKARISSPLNEEEINFNKSMKSVLKSIRQLSKEYNRAPASKKDDKGFQQQMALRYQVSYEAQKLLQHKYIAENPNSFFSLMALEELAGLDVNPDMIEPIFLKLSEEIRNTTEGKAFAAEIARARSLTVGSDAPDFEVPDINGKMVRLSDFKGKTVFLDFWASWCEPCRREHRKILEAYKQFKDKNFTIISVALDPPADRKYLLEAIKEDSMVWTNLADPKIDKNQAARVYGVKAIPQNFLIDSTGMIFNKDLSGESLYQQLNSLLNKQNE
ncbi:Peroxiredoxin [Chitinophaga ginsengisegetis]|uniref:Peroxiredoxin n=1 Tax=Chitinophaga ginsengisegetis TaxID=393003 RepID=A0A1T5N4K5_9BACT|nr:TlpA disulfide reductase family protein [Chitinophaga ginsengisegetis]MDR6570954.1 peroxiredoxin [Chitinophaga ginsengisegetis]MDR6650688.1 peroxiredoxin [Chitinophaga ginsengisegetis]MDR6657038.1 peroxiredoxin [Chitinophaga ginsengisegetis]SKC95119.1 Peroxiredoxin [Chitinophaga ginsengisegetis]